jgi:hypothetical protein
MTPNGITGVARAQLVHRMRRLLGRVGVRGLRLRPVSAVTPIVRPSSWSTNAMSDYATPATPMRFPSGSVNWPTRRRPGVPYGPI